MPRDMFIVQSLESMISRNNNENKNMIAQHSYEEDLPASYSNNIVAYCYIWLKSNVSLYNSATDV